MPQTTIDVEAVIAKSRRWFGEDFVPGRLKPEREARELLDAFAGHMSLDQAMRLGELINEHAKQGLTRHDRFSPAFVGASLQRLTQDLETFNTRVALLWCGDDEAALNALDETLKNRQLFPGAGSSFPSVLLYLRDPDRFAVWITATISGLRKLIGEISGAKAGGRRSYLQFCEQVLGFRNQWDVASQEVDAILAEASRTELRTSGVEAAGLAVVNSSIEALATASSLPVEAVEEWSNLLQGNKKQAVFYGPPGTGKTHVARLLAHHLAGAAERVRMVQFHPSYSYEDFVEGLRPELNSPSGGHLSYMVRPGLFLELCRTAAADPENVYALVIDEMNRADLGSVLGELMLLLEYREEVTVQLPYSQADFTIPKNLVVIATMNTADRSLALVDFAMRRRFHAIELRPNRDVLRAYLHSHHGEEASKPALAFFDRVQQAVGADSAFAPGHSYWMVDDPGAQALERVWKYEIRPYLQEFWFETPEAVADLDSEIQQLIAEQA